MPDLQKVIRGLECHLNPFRCPECPYWDRETPLKDCDIDKLIADALAILREQEPRVLSLQELLNLKHDAVAVWLEERTGGGGWYSFGCAEGEWVTLLAGENGVEDFMKSEYGDCWRVWTAKPTDEKRMAVKWDEQTGEA